MGAVNIPDYPRGLTFEQVWAALMEDREQMAKNRLEFDRRMKETDRIVQENARQMGYLNNRFGELAEHLVGPSIMEKFNEQGFNFTERTRDKEIREPDNPNTITEIDILLENGDFVIAVEIKSKPNEADVEKHIKRMEVLRRVADRKGDTRKYQGAIAGAIMNQSIRDYIIQNGFYMIEQSGDTVKLTIPKDFTPREW